MKIVNLVENTEGESKCEYAHGLSFYVETDKHKLLVDAGPSDITLRNAQKLGIDIEDIDTVILSHGHYDHSGGIIPFTKLNTKANIYLQKTAQGDFFADDGKDKGDERYRYIGIDKEIMNLSQIKILEGNYKIDDELSLFTIKSRSHKLPFTNKRLLIKDDIGYMQDDFVHEQYLVIKTENGNILISGCAHNGILSILDEYKKIYGMQPYAVISGFHLIKKSDYTDEELLEIINIAKDLKKYNTKFITCHCTGVQAYSVMKNIMGKKLEYVHSGDEVKLQPNKYKKELIKK